MKKLLLSLLIFCVFILMSSSAMAAVELSVGIGDYWGNFNLQFQKYELLFEVDGIGLLGLYSECRFFDNQFGVGINYVTGSYSFEGAGTTNNDEELEASGTRNRSDLDFWLRWMPSRHFSVLGGYKKVTFDFKDVLADWSEPEGKELHGEADLDLDGFAIGVQTAWGRRLIAVLSLSYFPSLSGNVTWDGEKKEAGGEWEEDKGDSTVDAQGFKLQFNVAKPFPSIRSALIFGYYLQIIADELDTINYRTDELFTGLMIAFSYTHRFGGPSEVDADEIEEDIETEETEMSSVILNSYAPRY
ncbi:hypothetical protein ACFL27_22305 [candidate division CSSED10-310 bacterium]|uniref:Outer membrane protein beta-barrel domain-containing protein n=1 Tax=candidate division CSSED10-310 bacterium TaxID=2855610 RepID=A0ABV6Z3B6_UNCC1